MRTASGETAAALKTTSTTSAATDPAAVLAWLGGVGHELTLNVAGPRESERPGTYATARALLEEVLGRDR